jgi:long-chain acyl-CoA synthetase
VNANAVIGSERNATLEYWARVQPDRVALIQDYVTLSWAAINDGADRLANALLHYGAKTGDVVGVKTQICWEWVIINAALAKLGCTHLALNWRLTSHETAKLLRDSSASGLVADFEVDMPATAGLPLAFSISNLDVRSLAFPQDAADILVRHFTPHVAPVIIFTSGTTGRPKGVLLKPQFADGATLEWREYIHSRRSIDLPLPNERVLLTMPLHHAAGPASVQAWTAAGSLLVLLPRFDPEAALSLIDRHRITRWNVVATMIHRIARLPPDILDRYDRSSLRHLCFGGGPVPKELKHWAIRFFGKTVVMERYGSTETGIIAQLPPANQETKPGSCGFPLKNVHVEVRDAAGQHLGPGETGEFWVRSPALADGYIQAPFTRDEFDERGFFRTGDVGYIDDDGALFITGRAKDVIISGGVNIYPAEIEAVLRDHPAIRDVVVVAAPDDEFGEHVKAVCELYDDMVLSLSDVADFCRPYLASYKIPKSLDVVDEIPRNAMGKPLKQEIRDKYWRKAE